MWLSITDNSLNEILINLEQVSMIRPARSDQYTRIWFCGNSDPAIIELPFDDFVKYLQNIWRINEQSRSKS